MAALARALATSPRRATTESCLAVDEAQLGQSFDGYHSSVSVNNKLGFGSVQLSAGPSTHLYARRETSRFFLNGSAFAGARSMLVTRYSRCTFRKAASHLARSHSTKATSSPLSVALHIARGLSGSTEKMNVRVRSLYPKADSRPGTES
jgi:hypothetical protein